MRYAHFPIARHVRLRHAQLALLLLLLMVCRRTITVLRETPLKILIPFGTQRNFQLGLYGLNLLHKENTLVILNRDYISY